MKSLNVLVLVVVVFVASSSHFVSEAFIVPISLRHPLRIVGNLPFQRFGHHQPPPPNDTRRKATRSENDDDYSDNTKLIVASFQDTDNDDEVIKSSISSALNRTKYFFWKRGGDTDASIEKKNTRVLSTFSYWNKTVASVADTLVRPIQKARQKASNIFKSKEQRAYENQMERFKLIPIQRVVAPNSTLLPDDLLQMAAQTSGLMGNPLRTNNVQELAQTLQRWYRHHGYLLHSVTGATLQADTATAEITVQEPCSSTEPVGITFYQEMIIDPETGTLLTHRQYKEQQQQSQAHIGRQVTPIQRSDLNTTYISTDGHTQPRRIARALGLHPYRPFQWDRQRWQQLVQSGIFSKIVDASPRILPDGTVQLHIAAVEAPSRHLEYGLGKSLYHDGWEGELEFEHANLLGGGETLGMTVKRGATDSEPSVRLKYSDGPLHLVGGYDIQAFSEYIGDKADNDTSDFSATSTNTTTSIPSYDHDLLMNRRGFSVQIKNPIQIRTISNSKASASIERTTTHSGLYESIGSVTVEMGPFLQELPLGARSNFDLALTTGSRLYPDTVLSDADASFPKSTMIQIKPYVSASATTRQLIPLIRSKDQPRPLMLAMRHTVTASTKEIPRHVAKFIGTSTNIRGTVPNGCVYSAVSGTAEIRVPIPILSHFYNGQQDLSAVLYGDWMLATKDACSNNILRKSCVGVGLRKNVQGIPLQYDVTYSASGKVKAQFGLGADFVF